MRFFISLIVLFLAACSSKEVSLPATPVIPVSEAKLFQFNPLPRPDNPDWLEPVPGAEERPGVMELDPVSFLQEGNRYWVAGALKEGMMVRRSFVFYSTDSTHWEELQPTTSGLAVAAMAWSNKGLVVIESIWTEGTYLVGAWVSDLKQKKWKNILFSRKEDWDSDPFRKAIKCCSELVNSFRVTPKFWELEVEGTEKEAKFRTTNQGKTWSVVKGSVKNLGSQVLDLGWKKVDWEGTAASLVEIQAGGKKFVLPKYWKFKKVKNKLVLDPIL